MIFLICMGEKDICKIMILGQNGLDDPQKSKFYENVKGSEKRWRLMKLRLIKAPKITQLPTVFYMGKLVPV